MSRNDQSDSDKPSADTAPAEQTPASTDDLADELTQRLSYAQELQRQADQLTDRIAELEVSVIAAEVRPFPDLKSLSPDDAANIGSLLVRQERLAGLLSALGPGDTTEVESDGNIAARLEEASSALDLWLHAPSESESKGAATGARLILLAATCAAIWGAIEYHPAVLALLIPVAAPIGLLLNRGDDKLWRRLGAKQRFTRTGVQPPREWDVDAVARRHEEIVQEMSTRERARERAAMLEIQSQSDATEATDNFAELSMQLVEVTQRLTARAERAKLDLDALTQDQRHILIEYGEQADSRSELEAQRKERARLSSEAGDIRDDIWRILNRRDCTPHGTATTFDALRAGLQQLESQT